MESSLGQLFVATATFVGGHFALSSVPVRTPIIGWLGAQRFRLLYSAIVAAAFVWMLFAYGAASRVELWPYAPWTAWIPVLVMPFASVLLVAGLTTPSVTLVGGEALLEAGRVQSTVGIQRITRHPFLWGTLLWAVSHLPPNGDAATAILCLGIAVLSGGGMAHIDARRQHAMGAAWGPIALTTSVMPFAAILSGRTKPDWAGIGLWRVAAGLALYVALVFLHGRIVGVPIFSG